MWTVVYEHDHEARARLFLLRQPDVPQILIDVVTRCDLPALHFRPVRHDALPPKGGGKLVSLFIDNAFLELPDELQAFFRVGGSALLVVQIVQHAVLVARVIDGTLVAAHELEELQIRVVHKITGEIDPSLVVTLAKIIEVGAFFLLNVIDIEPDLAPLIDDVDTRHFIGLSHVPVLEREGKPLRHSGFFQQLSRFLARRFDVFAEASELDELRLGYSELGTGPQKPAYILHHRDLRQRLGGFPPIDRKSECAANSDIVERLFFIIDRDGEIADPRAFLHHNLVTRGLHDVVARCRVEAPKFDERLPAAYRRNPWGGVPDDDCFVAIEIRSPLHEIIRILFSNPVRARDILNKSKRTCAHDVLFIPARIFSQDVGFVDEVPGRGQVGEKRRRRMLQTKYHCLLVRSLDLVHHRIGSLARAHHPFGRKNNLVVGCLHVFSSQYAAIMKLNSLANLEGISERILRDRPAFRHVTDYFRIILRIEPKQRAVVRRHRVQHGECGFPVAVIRRRRPPDGKHKLASWSRSLFFGSKSIGDETYKRGYGGYNCFFAVCN